MDLSKLKEPFAPEEIEWRVQSAGAKKDGTPWARVMAYVQSRAIMDRLDQVCGSGNWADEFREGPQGAFQAGIGIQVEPGSWVWKWDGSGASEIESIKGGYSGALKRAAVHWGIGRYLYSLDADFAVIYDVNSKTATHYQPGKDGKYPAFKWMPPKLPAWAVPQGTKQQSNAPAPSKEEQEDVSLQAKLEAVYQASRRLYSQKLIDSERGKAFKARIDQVSNTNQVHMLWKTLEMLEAAGMAGNSRDIAIGEAKMLQDDFIENIVDEQSYQRMFEIFTNQVQKKSA